MNIQRLKPRYNIIQQQQQRARNRTMPVPVMGAMSATGAMDGWLEWFHHVDVLVDACVRMVLLMCWLDVVCV